MTMTGAQRQARCYLKHKTEKPCRQCGEMFMPSSKRKVVCSDECALKLRAEKEAFIREVKPLENCVCAMCGEEYKSKLPQSRNNRYCSKDCKAQAACRHPHTCPVCGMRFRGLKDAIYCSKECYSFLGVQAAFQKAAQINKHKGEIRRQEKLRLEKINRAKLAKGIRLWRGGMNASDVAVACGYAESSGTSFLKESKAYRRATQRRLARSQWYRVELGLNARSKQYPTEKAFSDYAAQAMQAVFDTVEVEVRLPRSKRRIDLVVESGLFRFGVELKATCRTSRLDQLLGQALVKCVALGIRPVCVIPDDLKMDSIFKNGCKSLGVIAGTLSEVMHCMRKECGQ